MKRKHSSANNYLNLTENQETFLKLENCTKNKNNKKRQMPSTDQCVRGRAPSWPLACAWRGRRPPQWMRQWMTPPPARGPWMSPPAPGGGTGRVTFRVFKVKFNYKKRMILGHVLNTPLIHFYFRIWLSYFGKPSTMPQNCNKVLTQLWIKIINKN